MRRKRLGGEAMQDSNQFIGWTLAGLGAAGLAAAAALIGFPGMLRRGLDAFPRSKMPGWILSAIGTFWVTWVVYHAALGRFEFVKPLVPYAGVALFAALVYFLDELLAPRALGGLLLLVANPVLMGIRWTGSGWRIVPVLFAYAWVVAGCALMLHPWLFRKAHIRFLGSDAACRRWGWAKLAGGIVLLAAGIWHLR